MQHHRPGMAHGVGMRLVHDLDIMPGRLLDDGMREVTPRDPKAPAITTEQRLVVEGLLRARIGKKVEPVTAN